MSSEEDEKTTYQVRLPRKLLGDFLAETKSRDDNAASLIRKFMRFYIKERKRPSWQRGPLSTDSFDDLP